MIIYTKIAIDCFDTETGKRFQRYVDGRNAELWSNYMSIVCQVAQNHKKNPKWHNLKWQEKELVPENNRKKISLRDEDSPI